MFWWTRTSREMQWVSWARTSSDTVMMMVRTMTRMSWELGTFPGTEGELLCLMRLNSRVLRFILIVHLQSAVQSLPQLILRDWTR